jgi:hypothetical protein
MQDRDWRDISGRGQTRLYGHPWQQVRFASINRPTDLDGCRSQECSISCREQHPAMNLFDRLIREGEQRWREIEAQRVGGFDVDHQFEPGGLYYWQFGRPLTP